MSYIIFLFLISSIYQSSGWSFHYNKRFVSNGLRNVVSVPAPPVIFPRMNEASNIDSVLQQCTGLCLPKDECENGSISRMILGLMNNRLADSVINHDAKPTYCKESETCCKLIEEKNTAEDSIIIESNEIPKPVSRQCGKQNFIGMESRIGDGDTAQYAEFPWMIVVLMKMAESSNATSYSYKCGGSLIHPSVVLTAAHCVDAIKPGKLVIRAGDWDLSTTDEQYAHQDRGVRSIVIHKGFTKPSLHNDIALLILTSPVELTDTVNTICLPPVNAIHQNDKHHCFVAGWGKDSYGVTGAYQTVLKKVEVPIISNDVCQRQLRHTILGRYFRLHRSFICAGGDFGDACKGDGGSPLMCYNAESDGYYQVGIVAWGIGCNQFRVPAAYVNVGGMRRWIDHEMKKRNLEFTYYVE